MPTTIERIIGLAAFIEQHLRGIGIMLLALGFAFGFFGLSWHILYGFALLFLVAGGLLIALAGQK